MSLFYTYSRHCSAVIMVYESRVTDFVKGDWFFFRRDCTGAIGGVAQQVGVIK